MGRAITLSDARCNLRTSCVTKTAQDRSAWFIHRACLGTLLAALSLAAGHAGVVKSEPYIWTNVKWGGGGFVTGIVAHPSAPTCSTSAPTSVDATGGTLPTSGGFHCST